MHASPFIDSAAPGHGAAPGSTQPGGARHAVVLKRARDDASPKDGMRVLVDRLWPRGLAKERLVIDLWLKDVAPSTALRSWYGHDAGRWPVFAQKYRAELAQRVDLLNLLDDLRRRDRLTLLYDARDPLRNNAIVLRNVLSERRFVPRHPKQGVPS